MMAVMMVAGDDVDNDDDNDDDDYNNNDNYDINVVSSMLPFWRGQWKIYYITHWTNNKKETCTKKLLHLHFNIL